MKLNLTAHNTAEERIKAYLEQNASKALAEKINNGTPITKDGKALINRKTLDGFMKYATEEARKIAEKGARFACIDDNTVFGWSIHYFEEEAIEGEILNRDGTPYKAVKPKIETKAPTKSKAPSKPTRNEPKANEQIAFTIPTPKPEQKPQKSKPTDKTQLSIFD